eukprot:scaffold3319_cov258-Pinguiococcus_pyrenoidosus.AAC.13
MIPGRTTGRNLRGSRRPRMRQGYECLRRASGNTMPVSIALRIATQEELGLYWGFQVRIAEGLSKAISECPWEGGYDLLIGTSEKGNVSCEDDDFSLPAHKHALVVFGGIDGIEAAVEQDPDLDEFCNKEHELFDRWVNTCPSQGSRTIRSEEAILISLAKLQNFLRKANASS